MLQRPKLLTRSVSNQCGVVGIVTRCSLLPTALQGASNCLEKRIVRPHLHWTRVLLSFGRTFWSDIGINRMVLLYLWAFLQPWQRRVLDRTLTSATWLKAFDALVGTSTRCYTRKIEMGGVLTSRWGISMIGSTDLLLLTFISTIYSILGLTTELKLLGVKLTSSSLRLNGWKDSWSCPCVAFRGAFRITAHFYLKQIFRSTAPLPFVLRTCGFVTLPSNRISKIGGVRRFMLDGSVLSLKPNLSTSNPTWKSGIETFGNINTKKEQLLQRIQLIGTE